MKKILVPTDFSYCAEEAGKAAMELARITGASIEFLHLMDVPHDWIKLPERDQNYMYPDITKQVRNANQQLLAYVDIAEKKGLNCTKLLIYNEDFKYLIKYAEEGEFDYIVMGSNGASGFRELLLGSNTQRVIRNSSIPVLVIKEFPIHFEDNRIVFMSDFDKKSLYGFQKLTDVARTLKTKIHLLYINTNDSFETTDVVLERMEPYSDYAMDVIEGHTIWNANEYEEGIQKFIHTNTDILAMVTHRANNKLAQRVVNHLSVPMLNVNVAD